ncbi:unnamed protein product [Ixodes persulcatus]
MNECNNFKVIIQHFICNLRPSLRTTILCYPRLFRLQNGDESSAKLQLVHFSFYGGNISHEICPHHVRLLLKVTKLCKATDTAQQSPMLVQQQNNSTEPLESVNNVTTQEVPIHLDSGWNSTSLAYVFVPLGLVVCLGLAAALVVFLVRKSRLDRLRHHLMPFYSFDPQDEGEDWEAELLEEGLTHRPNPANKNPEFHEPPKLAFRSVL